MTIAATSNTPWPTVKLGDVCEIVLGGTPSTKVDEYWGGEINWLTPSDMGKINGMYVGATSRKITHEGLIKGSRLFPENSVIVSTRAPIGYVLINTVPMCTNQGCKTLVPDSCLLAEYLCFNLQGRTEELNALGTGTTFKELATGNLKSIEIPLPPLEVQREIVAKVEKGLAEADALVAHFKRLAALADETFKAELDETFQSLSAPAVKLGDVCEIARGGSPRPIKNYITTDSDGLNWIKIGDVSPNGKYIEKTSEKIKPSGLNKTRKVSVGDFLLSNSMSFGRPYILKIDGCIHDGWLVLKGFKKVLDENFFYYLLKSDVVQVQFELHAHGSTVRNLNTKSVEDVIIPLPSLDEQQVIVAKLEAVKAKCERLKAEAERGVKAAEALRKAVLAEAFER